MKLFKQKDGWTCPHSRKKKVKGTCQRCLFYDSELYFWLTIPLMIAYQPFWWIMYGRKMDKRGFMPDEEGYGKDRS